MSDIELLQKNIAGKMDELLALNSEVSDMYSVAADDVFSLKLQCSFYLKRFEKIESELCDIKAQLDNISDKNQSISISSQLLMSQLLMIRNGIKLLKETKDNIVDYDEAKKQNYEAEFIFHINKLKEAINKECL